MTREEANSQLEIMLLLVEPWTPEQWLQAEQLHQHIIGQGMACFDGPLAARWSYEQWELSLLRRQQAYAASSETMQPMSLADFKRELSQ